MLERWLDAPQVRRAMSVSNWSADGGIGDTIALLEEIIRQCDRVDEFPYVDQVTRDLLGNFNNLPSFNQADERHIILMLLDCGASPDNLKSAGFGSRMVDAVGKRSYAPWRTEALMMAVAGATVHEIRAAVPMTVGFRTVRTCLLAHGFELPLMYRKEVA